MKAFAMKLYVAAFAVLVLAVTAAAVSYHVWCPHAQ